MSDDSVIGAYSEEHAATLSGASVAQLRRWARNGVLTPSVANEPGRGAFNRVYSFRDLVSLRVLHRLRNTHNVSGQHLREVAAKLVDMGYRKWTAATLYVLNRRVVWDDPRTGDRRQIIDGQRVLDLLLHVVARDVRQRIQAYNRRGSATAGRTTRNRNIAQNQLVFAKTRIPLAAVRSYLEAGYDDAAILRNYPSLKAADIATARTLGDRLAA